MDLQNQNRVLISGAKEQGLPSPQGMKPGGDHQPVHTQGQGPPGQAAGARAGTATAQLQWGHHQQQRELQAARMGIKPMFRSSAAKPRAKAGAPQGHLMVTEGSFCLVTGLAGVGGRVQVPSQRSQGALQALYLAVFPSFSHPQRNHAKILLGQRNVCLLKDDTVRNKVEEKKPRARQIQQVRHWLPANAELMTKFLSCARHNYSGDLLVSGWRAGVSFILAHSYSKVLLCDYVIFPSFFRSIVSL